MWYRLNLELIGKDGISLVGLTDALYELMQNVPSDGIHWDLKGHSDGYVLASFVNFSQGDVYTADEVADLITEYTYWDGNPIRILACSAGKYNDGFAAQLSNILTVPIIAPIMDLWVDDSTYELIVSDADPNGFPYEYALFNENVQKSLWQEFPLY